MHLEFSIKKALNLSFIIILIDEIQLFHRVFLFPTFFLVETWGCTFLGVTVHTKTAQR